MRFRVISTLALAATIFSLSACGNKTPPAAQQTAPQAVAPAQTPPAAPTPTAVVEQAGDTPEAIAHRLINVIQSRYPSMKINAVSKVAGLDPAMYLVTVGDQSAYTNAAGDFFLVGGELLVGNAGKLVNVTKEEALRVGSKLYTDLPFDKAIKYVYGNGQRQLVVFSDPDCPFCQALEVMFRGESANLNATVYLLPYPIESLHPNAENKARQLLCQADPAKAWQDWMVFASQAAGDTAKSEKLWADWSARNPAPTNCARAADIEAIKKVGLNLGVNQTPTLMFSNGMPFFGLLDRTELEQSWQYVAANPQPPTGPAPAPAK